MNYANADRASSMARVAAFWNFAIAVQVNRREVVVIGRMGKKMTNERNIKFKIQKLRV